MSKMASQRLRFAANIHTLGSFGSACVKQGMNMHKSGSIAAPMSLHLNV